MLEHGLAGFLASASPPNGSTLLRRWSENSPHLLLLVTALIIPRFIPDINQPDSEIETWRSEFAHLTLHKLGSVARLSSSDILLYHMVNISLHVSLDLLQCFARSKTGDATDAARSLLITRVQKWISSRHGAVARWHAIRIVLEAQSHFNKKPKPTDEDQGQSVSDDSNDASGLGAPHVPYSVYYATLVLWSAATISGSPQMEQELLLRTGSHVLNSMSVRIAGVLANALSEVKH